MLCHRPFEMRVFSGADMAAPLQGDTINGAINRTFLLRVILRYAQNDIILFLDKMI